MLSGIRDQCYRAGQVDQAIKGTTLFTPQANCGSKSPGRSFVCIVFNRKKTSSAT
jgi:hypothetical protein